VWEVREMDYCVVVQAHGRELDRLRGEAYRVSRDARADWYVEPRSSGTAFCFENADVRTRFCAVCAKENVAYATEHPTH
jgi:hypothetical protein